MNLGEGFAFSILGFNIGFFIFMLLISLAFYILSSLGLYKLAVRRYLEKPWLAWIPIANLYVLAKLVESLKIGDFEIPMLEMVLPLGALVCYLITSIPVIGFIISILYTILLLLVLYNLYKIYRPDSAVLWIILSIVFPFLIAVFIFIIREDILQK